MYNCLLFVDKIKAKKLKERCFRQKNLISRFYNIDHEIKIRQNMKKDDSFASLNSEKSDFSLVILILWRFHIIVICAFKDLTEKILSNKNHIKISWSRNKIPRKILSGQKKCRTWWSWWKVLPGLVLVD